jgi:hypothetical protein
MTSLNSIWFIRRPLMAKKNSKTSKKVVDTKMAAANDTTEVVATPVTPNITQRLTADEIAAQPEAPATPKIDPSRVKGVALGIFYAGLSGKLSKQAVTACFGARGCAMNWVHRALSSASHQRNR